MFMFRYRKDKEPNFFNAFILGLLATFPPTRPLLHLHRRKIVNEAVIEPGAHESQIPVIYIHGFRGGDYTMKAMIDGALAAKKNTNYLRVVIDLFGNITLTGTWTADENPVVQVIFKQKIVGVLAICYYLKMVLPFLARTFNFTRYNAVAHSIGAPSVIRTEMKTKRKRKFPRLNKVVLIAGPFNGVTYLGDIPNVNTLTQNGRPILMNTSFVSMMLSRRNFAQDIAVLNIYGNIEDETNTDQFISVVSAKSIRYILAPIAASFRELEVRGPEGEHSKMHDSPLVIATINHFINFNHQYAE